MSNKTVHNFTIKWREEGTYDIYVDGKWVAVRGSGKAAIEELENLMNTVN